MKKLQLSWEKENIKEKYLIIPNKLIKDLSSNPKALTLLLLILTNKSEHFKVKKDVYSELGWNISNKRIWMDSISFLKDKGYVTGKGGEYLFSNVKKFDITELEDKKKEDNSPANKTKYTIDGTNIPTVGVEEMLSSHTFNKEIDLPF